MSQIKADMIRMIQMLPDDCTIEDIRYQLDLHEGVLKGMQAVEEGRVMSLEEWDRRMDAWLESYGRTPATNGSRNASTSSRKETRKERKRSGRRSAKR